MTRTRWNAPCREEAVAEHGYASRQAAAAMRIYLYPPSAISCVKGGIVNKQGAHEGIHFVFRQRFGWPTGLDEKEAFGRPRWSNAWSFALKQLYNEGITRPCTGKSTYELQICR